MQCEELGRALALFVGRQLAASKVDVVEFSRLSGGTIQNNYALALDVKDGPEAGRKELVVRSDAPSRVAASMTRPQEFRVLQVAHEAGVTVPRPLWVCDDTTLIGASFYVMTKAPGSAAPRQLLNGGLSRDQARALTRRLGAELARLHQVRAPDQRLAFMTPPTVPPALNRVRQYRDALAAIPEPHPALEWSLNWLLDRAPDSDQVVLCHGDFRTGNYMVDQGQLTAVLDWEFAAWSDPCEDLGWLCSRSWRFGHNDKEVGGIGDKADLFSGYADLAKKSVDPDKVLYWEVMALVRWAIVALQQAQRHLSGEQASLELALTGRLLPQIEFDLLTQIREVEGER